jgi:hypothetical protein
MVLAATGEAGWEALMKGLVDEAGEVSGWHLKALEGCLAEMEGAVTAGLRRALGDRRAVPLPPGAELVEEVIPELRICDLAYLGLRRNLAAESEFAAGVAASAFSSLAELERNREIVQFAQTGKFSDFRVTGAEED